MIPGIHEVQALATKYSKVQLQQMAQSGLIDPTKAVMAGMMIDRISKQNMEPPKSTVAQDVMAPPTPQMGMPQGQPQQEPPAGVSGIPAPNMEKMAGGGIVAFNDGGNVPGYADQGFVIDPETQRQRDMEWRLPILKQELQQAQAQGNAENVAALQREIRRLVPSKKADSGLSSLIPSAQAGELPQSTQQLRSPFGLSSDQEMLARRQIGVGSSAPVSNMGTAELMRQQVADEYGVSSGQVTPAQAAAAKQSAANVDKRKALQQRLEQLEQQYLYGRPSLETKAEMDTLKQQIKDVSKPVPVANVSPAAAPASAAPTDRPEYRDVRAPGNIPAGNAAPTPTAAPQQGLSAIAAQLNELSGARDVKSQIAKLSETARASNLADAELEAKRPTFIPGEKYEKSLQKEESEAEGKKAENFKMALINAGLAIAGGKSQYALSNIAEGAQVGTKQYAEGMKELTKAAKEREKALAAIEDARNTQTEKNFDKKQELINRAAKRVADAEEKGLSVSATLAGVSEQDLVRVLTGREQNVSAQNIAATNAAAYAARSGFTREEAMKLAMQALKDRAIINPTPAQIEAEMAKYTGIQSGVGGAPAAPVDYKAVYGIQPTR